VRERARAFPAGGKLCNLSGRAESLADVDAIPAQKFGGGHGTLAGGLKLEYFEGAVTGGNEESRRGLDD
jgi:hypothetical protein